MLNEHICSVVIPPSVKKIGISAFAGSHLSSVQLSEGLVLIEDNAFGETALQEINIPKSVVKIYNPFILCYKLEQINVEENSDFYKSVDGVLFSKNGHELVCFPNNRKEDNYSIPNGVIKISRWSFGANYNLKSVILPESLEIECSTHG